MMQMKTVQLVVEVPFTGGVAGTPRLTQVNHCIEESTNPTLVKPAGLGKGDTPAVPRDLVGDDLTGTLQAFVDGVIDACKTKEGI